MPNAEQMEAREINTLPRIVITAEECFFFPTPGKFIELSEEEVEMLKRLSQALKNQSP